MPDPTRPQEYESREHRPASAEPADDDDELSIEELEDAAGGTDGPEPAPTEAEC